MSSKVLSNHVKLVLFYFTFNYQSSHNDVIMKTCLFFRCIFTETEVVTRGFSLSSSLAFVIYDFFLTFILFFAGLC